MQQTKAINPAHRPAGEFVPKVILDAPGAFEARGGDLDRLRKAFGISRRRALELVLLGMIRQQRRDRL